MWADLFDYFVCACLIGGGFFFGRKSNKRVKPPTYKCTSCHHNLGFHTNKIGKCAYDSGASGYHTDLCKCLHYIGEQPPPTLKEMGIG